jgi:hypothetical protein
LRGLVGLSENLRRRAAKRPGKPRNWNRALLQLLPLEDRMAPAILPPTIGTTFDPDIIPLNGTAILNYTITNPNAISLTEVAFTDNLPSGVVLSAGGLGVWGLPGASITDVPGSSTFSLTGGTLAGNSTATVWTVVTGTTTGGKNNSVQVTSAEGGPGNTASATLNVVVPILPTFTMSFGASSIPLNGTTSLRFSCHNFNDFAVTFVSFNDTLPDGLVISTPNGYSGSAGGGMITANPGANVITLSGATIDPGDAFTFTVNVTGTTPGMKNNTTSPLTTAQLGVGGTASASINVEAPLAPTISKAFDPPVIPLNDTTNLTFTIGNPFPNAVSLAGVGFTDTLPAGLVVDSSPHVTSTAGGTVTAPAGSGTITLSGGTLAPYSSATITVNVTGTTVGAKNNSVQVTSTQSGAGNTATASLNVLDPAHVWYVTTTADDTVNPYPESLRYDIQHAQDGDLILVNPSPHAWDTDYPNIHLYGQIPITKSLTIEGNDVTNVSNDTPGGAQGRIFNILTAAPVEISHLKLINHSANHAPLDGGAIYSFADLTLDHVTVSGNLFAGEGGGIFNDGGTLTLTNCTVGGSADQGGGIYSVAGTVTLTSCTVSGRAGDGGGIYIDQGTVTLTGCNVVQGWASEAGGGIYNHLGKLTLLNCTVAGGKAGIGPDILDNITPGTGGGIDNDGGLLTLVNCTVAYNNATGGKGDGIYHSGASLLILNTIVANNGPFAGYGAAGIDPNNFTDLHVASLGGGVFWPGSDLIRTLGGVAAGSYPPDEIDTKDDPMLDAPWYFSGDLDHNAPQFLPRDNGGAIPTIALLPGSPAIGAGNPYLARDYTTSAAAPLAFDERGLGYPRFHADGKVDIGAFEVQDMPEFAYLVVPVSSLELLYGQGGAFKASIGFDGRPVTAGTVTFREGDTVLASAVPLDDSGQAVLPTATLSAGVHSLLVLYSGGPGYPATSYRAQLSVYQAPLTITANSTSKTYGQAVTFAGTEFTTDGLVNGDTVTGVALTSAGAAVAAGVGSYPIVPSAAVGSGLSNYTISYANGGLTVNPAALTITATNASKTYGQAVAFAGTEFTTTGLVIANGDAVTGVTLTSAGAAAAAPVAGSPYAIVPSAATGSGLSNYSITYANGALTVKPAPLVITADPKWKITGEANPAFTASYQGFVLGQDPGVLGGLLTFSTPATASSPPDTYAITPGGLISGNYAITFVSGTLTVYSYGQATNLLVTQVNAAGLAGGLQNSLDSQLVAAMTSFNAGNTTAGVNQLGAFINHVRAQRGKGIDTAVADALIALAQRIIRAVG